MTTITIPRALLEQALAALEYHTQQTRPIQKTEHAILAIRAELAKSVNPSDPLDWPLPCDIRIGGGTHSKGTSLRGLVLRMKALHEAAFPGQESITKEQQDANLELLRNPPTSTPDWHDVPTAPGIWLCDEGGPDCYTWTANNIVLLNDPALKDDECRWYGPIPQDKEGEKS